jgi:hypothetical protein
MRKGQPFASHISERAGWHTSTNTSGRAGGQTGKRANKRTNGRAGWRGWVLWVGVVVGKVSLNPHIWVVHIVHLPYLYTLNPCGLNYMCACTRTNQKRCTAEFCLYGDNKGEWSPKSALNNHPTPTHGVYW